MAIASVLLGILSFVAMVVGFFTTGVPIVGSIFSFGGPVLALAGIVTGGMAMSQSKRDTGETSGAAVAGLVVSIIGFVLSLIVALTCGLCNACLTTAAVDNRSNGGGFQLTGPNGSNNGGNLGQGFGQALNQALGQVEGRLAATMTISSLRQRCVADPTGASAEDLFLRTAFQRLQPTICTEVTDATVAAFSNDCTGGQTPCSNAGSVVGRTQEALAQEMAVQNVDQCLLLESGTAWLLLCRDPSSQMRIVGAENLAHVQ